MDLTLLGKVKERLELAKAQSESQGNCERDTHYAYHNLTAAVRDLSALSNSELRSMRFNVDGISLYESFLAVRAAVRTQLEKLPGKDVFSAAENYLKDANELVNRWNRAYGST